MAMVFTLVSWIASNHPRTQGVRLISYGPGKGVPERLGIIMCFSHQSNISSLDGGAIALFHSLVIFSRVLDGGGWFAVAKVKGVTFQGVVQGFR